jgi:hypothetical protein
MASNIYKVKISKQVILDEKLVISFIRETLKQKTVKEVNDSIVYDMLDDVWFDVTTLVNEGVEPTDKEVLQIINDKIDLYLL